jgi:SprT-like family protein
MRANAQHLFNQFNREFFDGALSGYRVVVCDLHERGLWAGEHSRKEQTIYIHSKLEGRALDRTLLHEMAHANSNDYHGAKWLQEMDRLAQLGADTEYEASLYR